MNYNQINTSIKEDFRRWSAFPLDFGSQIEVIKMNMLPRLLQLFQSIPHIILETQFKTWDKWISRFIWAGKRPRVKYKMLQFSKDEGGLFVPNLREYFFCSANEVFSMCILPSIQCEMERFRKYYRSISSSCYIRR